MEIVVYDLEESCPYLEGRTARLPLRLQAEPLVGRRLDSALAAGDRRVGRLVYRPSCPRCSACEPVRLPVQDFRRSRSQRRVCRLNADLGVSFHRPSIAPWHLALFNRHRLERGLDQERGPLDARAYRSWFLTTCTETLEMRFALKDRVVGVGIVDVGSEAVSAGYFYWDPDEYRRSLGVYSVLAQVAWARQTGRRYLYLGYYVAECRRLAYKATFGDHERLVDGRWRPFERRRQIGADGNGPPASH